MLEEDVKALYERMATADQPPSKISIPVAGRAGRARLNRRRATAIGTPLLAAVAVIAIALTGAIPGGLHRTQPDSAPPRAPRSFNLLVPFARFGWLPNNIPGYLRPTEDGYYDLNQGALSEGTSAAVELIVLAAGRCHVTDHMLVCLYGGPNNYVSPPVTLGRPVAEIDGHPAYWGAPPPPPPGFKRQSNSGSLAWQYASGGWAVVNAHTERVAVKVADHVRFGYAGEPAVRFPVQLKDVPADWQVYEVDTRELNGVLDPTGLIVTAGRVPDWQEVLPPDRAVTIALGQGAGTWCISIARPKHAKHEVINGYKVIVGADSSWPNNELCASDAAGTSMWIAIGPHPILSPVSIFAHHLRLLGSNPANWTTKPIN
jgi:hypothetical protein